MVTDDLRLLTEKYYNIQCYINQLNNKLQEIKKIKKNIENKLIIEFKNQKLENKIVMYQKHKIYIHQENIYDVLTFRFLEECLFKLFNDMDKVKQIIKFIKQQRHKHINTHIKIV